MNRDTSADDLLAAKFSPPKVPENLVNQESYAKLNAAQGYGLVTVVAPAGFGKSTLLAHYYDWLVSHGRSVAWLHLDSYDDGFGFWYYFCGALRHIDPNQDFAWVREIEESASLETPLWINRLINQIESIDAEFTLILDDYHLITNKSIHNETEHLVSYIPPNMHLVIASREAMPFPLARLRMQQQVFALTEADLAFNYDEVYAYLNKSWESSVTSEEAVEIAECTKGWITGIKIIAMSHSIRPLDQTMSATLTSNNQKSMDMRQIYAYLSEEVLRPLSSVEQEFLVRTAFLDTLTASLCDYVLEIDNSAQLLASFESSNLFINSMYKTQGSWRLHPLFREFLDDRAKASYGDERRNAVLRAARWMENNGLVERAVGYYIEGGDFERALVGVEEVYWSKGTRRAYTEPVIKLLSRVPPDLLVEHPRCISLYAVLLFGTGAGSDLARCIRLVRERGLPERPAEPRDARDWDMVRSLATYTDGRYRAALGQFGDTLAQRTYDSFRTDGLLWIFVARCHYALGEEQKTYDAVKKSIDNARTHRMTEEYLMASCELARVKHEFGSCDESDRILRDALEYANWHSYQGITTDIMEYALAASEAQRGQLSRLRRFMDEREGFIVSQKRDFDGWICAPDFFVAVAEGYFMLEHYEQAEAMIVCAKDHLKRNVSVAFLSQRIAFLRLRVWSMAGQREKVENWVQARKERRVHREGLEEACELLVDALAALLAGDMQRALLLLNVDLPSDAALPLSASRIDYHLMKALASAAVLDYEQARNQMLIALRLGSQSNRVQQFVCWGPWVADMVRSVVINSGADNEVSETFKAYVLHVGDTCRQHWMQASSIPYWLEKVDVEGGVQLTEREREILEGLVAHRTADEIARTCFISRSTAQAHIQNIYRKLNVHNRAMAIEKGRRVLGLKVDEDAIQSPRLPLEPDAEQSNTGLERLSTREAEICKHMVEGKDNREIARLLVMSEQTVRTHVKNIYRKLGVHSRAEAVRAALASDDSRLMR